MDDQYQHQFFFRSVWGPPVWDAGVNPDSSQSQRECVCGQSFPLFRGQHTLPPNKGVYIYDSLGEPQVMAPGGVFCEKRSP